MHDVTQNDQILNAVIKLSEILLQINTQAEKLHEMQSKIDTFFNKRASNYTEIEPRLCSLPLHEASLVHYTYCDM
jgi:hypothetical protein